jgi:hypothetical protein
VILRDDRAVPLAELLPVHAWPEALAEG